MSQQPPTISATQIAVGGNIGEIVVTLGQTLIVLGDPEGAEGTVATTGMPHWFQSVSFSPQIAQQLVDRLSNALMEYQHEVQGAVPRDPTFSINPGKTLQ